MGNSQKVIYRDVQRPRQIWLWGLIILITVYSWYVFIQQVFLGVPIGDNPAPDIVVVILWLIFGILFPLMACFLKLIIEVRCDGLYVRFSPFHLRYRTFLFQEIIYYEPIDYSALDYGGRGIRINLKGETAYSMNGEKGIRLKLKNETVVITTEKQYEIIHTMDALKKKD